MKTVTVKKEVLLEKLIENRAKHIEELGEAMAGWVKAAIKELQDEIDCLKKDPSDGDLHFNLSKPVSHEKNYDIAISMLEMEVNDTVEIEVDEFQKYVNDEWDWSQSFKHLSSFYTSGR